MHAWTAVVGTAIATAIAVDVVTLVIDRSIPHPWIVFGLGGGIGPAGQIVDHGRSVRACEFLPQ